MFRPCFLDIESYTAAVKGSDKYVGGDFIGKYYDQLNYADFIADCAKLYILDHYSNVVDWSNLSVNIKCKQGKFRFHNHEKAEGRWQKIFGDPNPVITLTDVVLDPTDGDFSLTINGKELWWINNESIVTIASYIETTLEDVDK